MIKYFFYGLILCVLSTKIAAQTHIKQYTTESSDTLENGPDTALRIYPLALSRDSIQSLKSLPDYAYMHHLDSLLNAQKKQPTILSAPKGNSLFAQFILTALQPLLWIFAALLVAYIVYKIFITRSFFSKPGRETTKQFEEPEFTLDRDFTQLSRKAKESGDYRSAVRFEFLGTLKKLNDQSLIYFSMDKTNNDYFNELPETMQLPFLHLKSSYEITWYGNTNPGLTAYETIENQFQNFNQKIQP